MTEQEKSQETGEKSIVKQDDKTPVHSLFPRFPSREDWATMETISKTFLNAGAMPKGIDTAPKMMVILQAGREAGLSPIEALNSLYFVNGKVAMYGDAVPLQIMRAGHSIKWGECNAETATVTITRGDNGDSMTQTFTMSQARDRGYTKNPVYQSYPENMLKWRVLGMTAKFICPDALRGIGIKEDMEAEVVQEGSKFENKEQAQDVKSQIESGKMGHRPLDDTLNTPQSKPEEKEIDTNEANEKLLEKRKADEEGRLCPDCGTITKTKAGMTKHLGAQHGKTRTPDGKIVEITEEENEA